MCLIAVKPRGVLLPKSEYLINASETNRDGIGVAYNKNDTNEIIIKKDFKDVKDLCSWLISNITIDDALIIHFRLATSGLKDEGNRHPFPITKNVALLRSVNLVCQSALAHNGVFRDYTNTKICNDTQKFIMDIISDEEIKNNLKNPAIKKLIENYINLNKLAIILNNGEIILFGTFYEDEGVSYSNIGYRTSWTKRDYDDYMCPKRYKKENYSTVNKDAPIKVCENCNIRKNNEIIELWFKKVKLTLCKDCRKKLALGHLDKLITNKKTLILNCSVNASDTVKCTDCFRYVKKEEANILGFGMYICNDCKKIRDHWGETITKALNDEDDKEEKKEDVALTSEGMKEKHDEDTLPKKLLPSPEFTECEMCKILLKTVELVTCEGLMVCKICDKELKYMQDN